MENSMKMTTRIRHIRKFSRDSARTSLVLLLCFHLFTGCDASLATAVQPDSPEPQAGFRDYQSQLHRHVPGGHVNTAGGNLLVSLSGLSLDTALGTEEITPIYNSASNEWRFGAIDMTYDSATFVDQTGSRYAVASVPDGAAIPGSAWIKVDADTIRAKDGLTFEFDGGVLAAKHRAGQQCPKIVYEYGLSENQIEIRQQGCSVRGEWSTFNTRLFSLSVDGDGRIVAVGDRAGRAAIYAYDERGRLVTARDAVDVERGAPGDRLEYSGARGPLTAIVNSEGERVEYEYFRKSALGALRLLFATQVAQAGEDSRKTRFDYYPGPAPNSGETVVTDPLGDSERFSFDGDRRVLRIDYVAIAESEFFTYAGTGLRPDSHILPNGTTESYTRNSDGDILTITQPSGNVVVHTYAEANSPFPYNRAMASKHDDLGSLGSWTYTEDAPIDYKRLASASNGEGEETHYSYHPNGGFTRLASITGPNSITRGYDDYGALGRATSTSVGPTIGTTEYDATGNRTKGSLSGYPELGGVLARAFDADRNPIEATVANTAGEQSSIQLERRSDGRILSIDRPPLGLGFGPDHRFTYNSLGEVVQSEEMVDEVWQSTTYTHDARGRTGEALPNGMSREWQRDQRGRLTEHRVYRYGVLAGEIRFSYLNGNFVQIDDSERGTTTYSFDVAGRPSLIQFAGGETTEHEFDVRSRLVKETYRLPDASIVKVVEHEYDLADRETRVYDDAELVLERTFEDARLVGTWTGNGLNRRFTYDPVSGIRDGAITTNSYLDVFETTTIAVTRTEKPSNWEASTTTDITGLGAAVANFTLGPGTDPAVPGSEVGKRVHAWDNGMADSQTYAYDELSNQVDDADGDLYDYNSEGNRLLAATVNDVSVTYSYDAAGFADTRDGLTIEWTASGQMAAYDGYEAEWDMLGRPLRITDTNSSPGVVRDWSRWGGRIEVDGDGFMVALDLGEVALGFDGARRYRHFDFRGNVSFISDDGGTIATLYAYSPYGVNAVLGDGSDTPSFAGRSELGPFMLLGARMYDPLVGRFISPDPVFNLMNQYTYTLGNPIWFWDPDGRASDVTIAADVAIGAMVLALAIVGVAMAAPIGGLTLGLALVNLAAAAFGIARILGAFEPPAGPDAEINPDPAGFGKGPADPRFYSDKPKAMAVSVSLVGGGGGPGGIGSVPACGLTGIEFLLFIGWVLGRKKKRSAR
jgi:RHS repeat-associated protein